MALDYRRCAEEIVANIGGRDNVAQAAHCATRLRLVIKDNGKIKTSELENVDGVKGMFENNGQLQLIIGTGTVNKVYDFAPHVCIAYILLNVIGNCTSFNPYASPS